MTIDVPRQRVREVLGLVLPASLACGLCSTVLASHICWDADAGRLACLRCATVLHRLDRDSGRFLTVTLDVRGRVEGMGYLPAGQAIAVLIRFGARVV